MSLFIDEVAAELGCSVAHIITLAAQDHFLLHVAPRETFVLGCEGDSYGSYVFTETAVYTFYEPVEVDAIELWGVLESGAGKMTFYVPIKEDAKQPYCPEDMGYALEEFFVDELWILPTERLKLESCLARESVTEPGPDPLVAKILEALGANTKPERIARLTHGLREIMAEAGVNFNPDQMPGHPDDLYNFIVDKPGVDKNRLPDEDMFATYCRGNKGCNSAFKWPRGKSQAPGFWSDVRKQVDLHYQQ